MGCEFLHKQPYVKYHKIICSHVVMSQVYNLHCMMMIEWLPNSALLLNFHGEYNHQFKLTYYHTIPSVVHNNFNLYLLIESFFMIIYNLQGRCLQDSTFIKLPHFNTHFFGQTLDHRLKIVIPQVVCSDCACSIKSSQTFEMWQ